MKLFRFCLLLAFLLAPLPAQNYDLLIRNGRILDGAGNPWFRGSVGIRGDRIAAMGQLPDAKADRTIDARGQIIAPGFIDIHNHSRRALFDVPGCENFVRQGVTTMIEGNDGGSPLPLKSFFDKIRETGVALNVGAFVGHGSIRREVLGAADRDPATEEIEKMKDLARKAMEQGALGLSTGLFYIPGAFAETEEVIALARVAAEYHGMHISHMRDEAAGLLDSVRETIRIGEDGGLPTQVTHHKAVGRSNWGKSRESLRLIDEARARGVDVSVDQYPYTASHTGSTAMFPQWAQEGGAGKLLERLQDPGKRARILEGVLENIRDNRGAGDPANIQFAQCDWDSSLNGKTLADATRRAGREVTLENAAVTAIEIQEKGGCRTIYHSMNEEDVRRIIQYPGTMIASDGGVTKFGEGIPHPRYYGTFPRVLGHYVREERVLRLEDAVRKMTSLPAQRLGFWDRGLIRPGMIADITIFDPGTIIDKAKFGDSHHYAEGVLWVIVNGQIVLDDGRMTGARPGRVILGPGLRDK